MSEKVKKANLNRAQKAKAEHKKQSKIRKDDAQAIKVAYLKDKDSPVLADILAKGKKFQAYHNKICQDGVGMRATGDFYENKQPVMETYFLRPSERVSHADKSAGIQELLDYIERQLTVEDPSKKKKTEKKEKPLV